MPFTGQKIRHTAQHWFESPGGGARLLPMEGLRGLAVLVVFFVHAHAFFGPYIASYPRLFSVSEYLGRIGNAGVDLFFVLSGFIIYGALVRKRIPYFTFLRRRVKRIYPTFLAVLSIYLLLSLLLPAESRIPAHSWAAAKYIAANILFLPGVFRIAPIITVAWSLSFEFAFYICAPLVVLVLGADTQNRFRRLAILTTMWLCFSIVEVFLHGTHIRMLSFFSGMLLQEVTAGKSIRLFLSRKGQWVSIAAVVLLASYHFVLEPKLSGTHSSGVLSLALMSVAIFSFVLHALEYPGALQKVCVWTPLRYWGNISYSYYLAHGITLNALATLLARLHPTEHPLACYSLALSCGMLATWVGASMLYLVVERPFSLAPKKHQGSPQAFVTASLSWSWRRGRSAAQLSGNP